MVTCTSDAWSEEFHEMVRSHGIRKLKMYFQNSLTLHHIDPCKRNQRIEMSGYKIFTLCYKYWFLSAKLSWESFAKLTEVHFLTSLCSIAMIWCLWKSVLFLLRGHMIRKCLTKPSLAWAYCSLTGVHPSLSKQERMERSEGYWQRKPTHTANKEACKSHLKGTLSLACRACRYAWSL